LCPCQKKTNTFRCWSFSDSVKDLNHQMQQSGGLLLIPGWTGITPYASPPPGEAATSPCALLLSCMNECNITKSLPISVGRLFSCIHIKPVSQRTPYALRQGLLVFCRNSMGLTPWLFRNACEK